MTKSKKMNFINKLFRQTKAESPRCLGKGNVDFEDIKRLQKRIMLVTGKMCLL